MQYVGVGPIAVSPNGAPLTLQASLLPTGFQAGDLVLLYAVAGQSFWPFAAGATDISNWQFSGGTLSVGGFAGVQNGQAHNVRILMRRFVTNQSQPWPITMTPVNSAAATIPVAGPGGQVGANFSFAVCAVAYRPSPAEIARRQGSVASRRVLPSIPVQSIASGVFESGKAVHAAFVANSEPPGVMTSTYVEYVERARVSGSSNWHFVLADGYYEFPVGSGGSGPSFGPTWSPGSSFWASVYDVFFDIAPDRRGPYLGLRR